MTWDKHQHFTRNGYCGHVYDIARETMRGLHTDPIDGITYLPYWWYNGEVRVFWEPSITQHTVDLIINAVHHRVDETIGVSLDFRTLGSHRSAIEQIETATMRGELDHERLFSLGLSEPWRDHRRDGRQHGDIYITTKPFVTDSVSWAAASFRHGVMMFCLHGQRQHSHDFLRRVSLHETNHLLGMWCHCDDYQNVAGLPYTPRCNMHYSCPSADLCPKCKTYIQWFWQGVQDEMVEAQSVRA